MFDLDDPSLSRRPHHSSSESYRSGNDVPLAYLFTNFSLDESLGFIRGEPQTANEIQAGMSRGQVNLRDDILCLHFLAFPYEHLARGRQQAFLPDGDDR